MLNFENPAEVKFDITRPYISMRTSDLRWLRLATPRQLAISKNALGAATGVQLRQSTREKCDTTKLQRRLSGFNIIGRSVQLRIKMGKAGKEKSARQQAR